MGKLHTHTHTHTYIYIYRCVCVYVCVCLFKSLRESQKLKLLGLYKIPNVYLNLCRLGALLLNLETLFRGSGTLTSMENFSIASLLGKLWLGIRVPSIGQRDLRKFICIRLETM